MLSLEGTKVWYLDKLLFIFADMEKKKDAGAPKKPDMQKKVSMTVSISKATSAKALKLFRSRGHAIEMAVKYHKLILQKEKELKLQHEL